MDKQYNIKTNSERKEKQYWIDRKGNIHKFKGDMSKEYVSLHYQIAHKLFPTKENPEKYLEVEGWIKSRQFSLQSSNNLQITIPTSN